MRSIARSTIPTSGSSSSPAPASTSPPATISAAPQEMEDQKKTPLEPGFKGEYRRLWERFFENTMRWRDLPKPTIAQVQGYCIMGGMMIASACDLIIASDDALFADRAVKWGGAHVQYFSMPWDLGPRKAKEYLFTGEFISAAEAEKLGLVNRVVPRARLEEETMKLAQQIAERDPVRAQVRQGLGQRDAERAGLARGDGRRVQELHADHPAPHRARHLRRRGAREEPEGPVRRAATRRRRAKHQPPSPVFGGGVSVLR